MRSTRLESGASHFKQFGFYNIPKYLMLFIITKSTNIFNNFLNKQKFYIPTNGHENLIGSSCFPSFSHLRHVYALEKSKVLKIAHVLKNHL